MCKENKISSFAVLDLETNNLSDYNFNKASIMEISILGFAAKHVRQGTTCSDIPRIIHKLTLLFNPRAMIHPEAEKITGLDNYMLEEESWFDRNAGNGIVSFLKHLQQPVCLVAHNGDGFDFPILKQALEKVQVVLPSDILCIDSLTAFRELDRLVEEKKEIIASLESDIIPLTGAEDSAVTIQSQGGNIGNSANIKAQEKEEKLIEKEDVESKATVIQDLQEEMEKAADWKKFNETTPKRPTTIMTAPRENKRLRIVEGKITQDEQNIKPRRSLFQSPTTETKTKISYEPGKYKLENIYRRLFHKSPESVHHAESDVINLNKVMLHYGKEFMEYAESNAKPFKDVKKLGTR